jgi:hypothetical protein
LLALLLCSAWGVLHGQEQEEWHLITETELQSIEAYRRASEAEKQSWLSQARTLSARAGSLEAESRALNSQLQNQRELNQSLTQSFNEYGREQSLLLSRKDTQIAGLEAENEAKGRATVRLAVAVAAMGLAIILYAAAKLAGIFR